MQFELSKTKALLANVNPHRELHGEDPKPAGDLKLTLDIANDELAMFHPALKGLLYRFPNPDGNYEPGNVRWATPTQQMANMSAGGHYNAVRDACKRGHPFTPENTYVYRSGHRKCRKCAVILIYQFWAKNGRNRSGKREAE